MLDVDKLIAGIPCYDIPAAENSYGALLRACEEISDSCTLSVVKAGLGELCSRLFCLTEEISRLEESFDWYVKSVEDSESPEDNVDHAYRVSKKIANEYLSRSDDSKVMEWCSRGYKACMGEVTLHARAAVLAKKAYRHLVETNGPRPKIKEWCQRWYDRSVQSERTGPVRFFYIGEAAQAMAKLTKDIKWTKIAVDSYKQYIAEGAINPLFKRSAMDSISFLSRFL